MVPACRKESISHLNIIMFFIVFTVCSAALKWPKISIKLGDSPDRAINGQNQ